MSGRGPTEQEKRKKIHNENCLRCKILQKEILKIAIKYKK